MIGAFFQNAAEIAQEFIAFLVSLFENVITIFWTAPTGTETVGHLTVVGTLFLMGVITGLVMWAISFLRGLIRIRHKA